MRAVATALFEYHKISGRPAEGVLLGKARFLRLQEQVREAGRYMSPDGIATPAQILGLPVYVSQHIHPEAIHPLGDPTFDALYGNRIWLDIPGK